MTLLAAGTLDLAIVLLVAFAASVLLRRRSAALRHAVLAAAVLAGAAAPAVELVVPRWEVPVAWGRAPHEPPATTLALAADATIAQPIEPLPAAPRESRVSLGRVVASVWILGAMIALAGLATGLARLVRLTARCTIVTAGPWREAADAGARRCGLSRHVRLLQSPDRSLLLTWGLVRPVIVLPAGAGTWDAERRDVVLTHELAHIRRHDWTLQIAAEIVRAAHWFNPLVWFACRRLRHESERACDDAVLDTGVRPATYASHLLEVARHAAGDRLAWAAASAVANPSTLERRIAAMLKQTPNREPLTWRAGALAIAGALAVTASVTAVGVTQRAAPAEIAAPLASLAPDAQRVPVTPVTPATPRTPATPAGPGAPDTPATPETPVTRATPTAPATPATPRPLVTPPAGAPVAPTAPRAAVPAAASAPAPPATPAQPTVPAPPQPPPAWPIPSGLSPQSPGLQQPPVPPAPPAQPVNLGTVIVEATTFISGTIDDPSGGVLPGAQLSLLDSDFIVRATTVSHVDGRFSFRVAQPGRYYIVANHPGSAPFSTAVFAPAEGLRLRLPVAGVEESIAVTCSGTAAVAGPMLGLVSYTVRTGATASQFAGVARVNSPRGQPVVSRPALQETTTRPQPVRVGGNIEAARRVTTVNPRCPNASMPGDETIVVLSGRVDTEGALRDLRPERIAGVAAAPQPFIDAALGAVREWAYAPAQLNGVPIDVPARIRVEFRRAGVSGPAGAEPTR